MALRTINLSNTVDQWRSQYNNLATDVGDLSLLGTTHDSNLVLAINELIGEYDSATVIRLARGSFSAGSGLSYDSSIGRFTLGANNIITFAMMTDSSVGVTELRNNAVTTAKILNDAVTTAKILDDAVTYAKIQNVATANRLLGSTTAGGAVSEVRLTTAMITPSAVDSAALDNLSVSTAKIQADAVTSAKLASSVTLIIYNSAGTALKTLYGAGA